MAKLSEPASLVTALPGRMTVRTDADIDRYIEQIRKSTKRAQTWLAAQSIDSLELFHLMKFGSVGFHPIDERAINLIEQVNQTWTYIAALAAARWLIKRHREVGAFLLAPGAHAALELDIMSEKAGFVGAETFAAVKPTNNNKLKNDIAKLTSRPEEYRYVFFLSPRYPTTCHQPKFDPKEAIVSRNGIQVWSVAL